MSKNIFRAIAVTTLVVFSVFSQAQAKDYVEGKDYKVVSQNRLVEPEIREFFSFFCSHCIAMDKFFQDLATEYAPQAKWVYNPVGVIGGEIGVESQKAYAVALNHGLQSELKAELFDLIHKKQKMPEDHEFFVKVLNDIGIPSETADQDYASFVTQAKVAEYDKKCSDYGIEAVPEIVVNGKYLVITDNLDSAEDYKHLIDYLLTLK